MRGINQKWNFAHILSFNLDKYRPEPADVRYRTSRNKEVSYSALRNMRGKAVAPRTIRSTEGPFNSDSLYPSVSAYLS